MEMYRALAPCTVDGEDLSWCLADGLTWSQSTLNTLWFWECSYPMLTGGFWWNKDKPSPQSAKGNCCRHLSTPTLTLGVDARTMNTSPDITPGVWSPSPAPGRKGCSSCAASWAMVGCASYLSSQLVSERAGVVPQHLPHCTKLGVLHHIHPCREWCRYIQCPLAGQEGVILQTVTLYCNSRVTGWHPQSPFWSPVQNHDIGELWSSESSRLVSVLYICYWGFAILPEANSSQTKLHVVTQMQIMNSLQSHNRGVIIEVGLEKLRPGLLSLNCIFN